MASELPKVVSISAFVSLGVSQARVKCTQLFCIRSSKPRGGAEHSDDHSFAAIGIGGERKFWANTLIFGPRETLNNVSEQ